MAGAPRNPRVFMDIAIGMQAVGRVRFELFHDVLPVTSENFRALCTGETGLGYWLRPRWYRQTRFHRIIPGFMCQGGDFNFRKGSGMMGESIYGQGSQFFRDEKFAYKHSKRGVLSMANCGIRNSNSSIFFITFAPAPWLDGKHVVFGHMIDGDEVLDAIEQVGTEGGQPRRPVEVYNCGEEDRLLMRQKQLDGAVQETQEMLEDQQPPGYARPEVHPHLPEESPLPEDVWRRARSGPDNML
eukprot:gnl/MRDRNA2_/MRDRNA2_69792_c0_seq2.p1 gnl/MRDRNA2_/MRDRNA2_69792_c0~~gnl/MRDRNA2_/MRDRNA2_69792_c0_seq2.p1  ORF type:complete len:242 (-),score=40.58 gnl/MRDRNA2_/MRDRNA2_69792_c0_seq2:35-760(-)